jgi:hypothetical protein
MHTAEPDRGADVIAARAPVIAGERMGQKTVRCGGIKSDG